MKNAAAMLIVKPDKTVATCLGIVYFIYAY